LNHSAFNAFIASSIFGIFAVANTAQAVTVAPGTTVNLPGTTLAADPSLAGTVLLDISDNFSLPATTAPGAPTISGVVQERIVRETSTGDLDFYWRVYDVTGGSLGYFRIGDFNSSVFDANYRTDGLGAVGPTSVTRSSGSDSSFANFNFENASGNNTLPAGGSGSYFLFLHTTATQYAQNAFFDVASSGTFTASSLFAAYSPVPLPSSFVLMLLGLGVIGVVTGRRHHAATLST
jgi:hypothetical protein